MVARRFVVVGTSCAGKTTLAKRLGEKLGIPHTQLDELYWGPNWTGVPRDEFRRRVAEATALPEWVIDGNYSPVRDLVWRAATTLVWLDYPFSLVVSRAFSRTLRRAFTREELFAGNRERIWTVFSPEWIPWWVVRTHHRRQREIPELLRQPEYAHLRVIELAHPRDAERFIDTCES